MKFKLLLLLGVVVLSSCGKKTRLERIINEADVVKVFVYPSMIESTTKPILHYETNDIDKIKEWKKYISDRKIQVEKDCDKEKYPRAGMIIFKVSEDSTVMTFSPNHDCIYLHYTADDTLFIKEMTPEGIAYIENLMKRY